MIRKILPRLAEWRKSDLANVIIISGAGEKAFCAGGDVKALALQNGTPEGQQASKDYFAQEYQLDHYIATYDKPYIAMMDGITMGGGVGLSIHAPFRIATERTVFAMPETGIGFFPDVGASFFLPRLDGSLGTFLAMTAGRYKDPNSNKDTVGLKGADVYRAGIATHYLDSSVLAPLTARLAELTFPDHFDLARRNKIVNDTIAEFVTDLPPSPPPNPNLLADSRYIIDALFSPDPSQPSSLPALMSTLRTFSESDDTPPVVRSFASSTLSTLSTLSPLSLAITLHQCHSIGGSRSLSIAETFRREHAVASHFMSHPASDFNEGIRAKLVEKRDPNWADAGDEIQLDDLVGEFWLCPPRNEALQLATDRDYQEYQWDFGLPSERAILKIFSEVAERNYKEQEAQYKAQLSKEGKGEEEAGEEEAGERFQYEPPTDRELIMAVLSKWKGKPWVREKVVEVLKYQLRVREQEERRREMEERRREMEGGDREE